MSEFEGKVPRGPKFDRLVDLFWENLPLANTQRWAIEDSLRHCAGTLMTKDLIREVCWRMAGNLPRLRHSRAVPPWHGQRVDEWVALQVISCQRLRMGRDSLGASLGMRVLGGTPTPRVLFRWWSLKQCRFMSKDFGFSKPWKADAKYPYAAPEQFVGLRLYGLLEVDRCGQEPVISAPSWPASVRDYNRAKLKARFRVDRGYVCPRGFPHTFRCHNCPLGYVSCGAACHKLDWEQKFCPQCKKRDAFFDPEFRSEVCVDCTTTNAYKGG